MRTLPNITSRHLHLKASGIYRRYIENNRRIEDYIPAFEAIEMPIHGSYTALLFSPKWKAKREEILNRDAYQCVHCHAKENLQVHHRQYHFNIRQKKYQDPWDYDNSLLITLCELCHRRGHDHYKIPTIIL